MLSLLDPSNEYYVLHEKTWKFGEGEIYTPQGEQIGTMKRKLVSMRAEVTLKDSDESLLCIINKRLVGTRPVYDVKSPEGELIARAKKPLVAFRESIGMYDTNGYIIYRTQGDVIKWNFTVTDPRDKKRIYAEINKANRWRDIFAKSFSFKNRYVIRVVDRDAPRLMLISYAIIIGNVYHDKQLASKTL